MTVLPVIERELRAEARNSYHHWLRLTSTTAVLIYFYLIAQGYERPAPWLGRRLFQALGAQKNRRSARRWPERMSRG